MVEEIINSRMRKPVVKSLFGWMAVVLGLIFIKNEIQKYLPQFFISPQMFDQILIGWTAFIILLIALAWILHKFRFLKIEEDGLMKQTGVFSVHELRIRYEKITHSNFNQTFLERILGIGTLKVDTAGTGAVELVFHDIEHTKAREIIKLIEERGSQIRYEKKRDEGSA